MEEGNGVKRLLDLIGLKWMHEANSYAEFAAIFPASFARCQM